MDYIKGKGVSEGYAFGNLRFYERSGIRVTRRHVEDVDRELSRFEHAKKQAILELDELYHYALPRVGQQIAVLFEVYQMMLDDDDYCESIVNIINTKKTSADFAIAMTEENFSKMFYEMDDLYMRERAADVKDVSWRLICCLRGMKFKGINSVQPVIIAANDLLPSEIVMMEKLLLAFVTLQGSSHSHTSILARAMGIPAIAGMDALPEEHDGKAAVVNGFDGELYIEPDEKIVTLMREKQKGLVTV